MTNWLNIGTFIAAVIAGIFSFVMWRIDRDQELSRLMALYNHLNFIKESARGHQKHVQGFYLKKTIWPSWPVPNMDLNFYLTHIRYKVRRKRAICCFEPTRSIKQELISVHEKIHNINYLWRLKLEEPKVSSDLDGEKYYKELYSFIDNCQKEIRRILTRK